MNIDALINELKRYQIVSKAHLPEMAFDVERVIDNGPILECYRENIPSREARNHSGVYFFYDEHGNILYIGKAASNNLEAEIFSKFRAPVENDGCTLFENSPMATNCESEGVKSLFLNGNVFIRSAIISPGVASSVVEVYLQTYYSREVGKLPCCNKRIG